MANPGGAKKKIWYACVARGGVVAAEESGCAGNANLVAAQLLQKLEDKSSTSDRCSFAQDGQLFHVLTSRQMKGVTCICMADEAMGRRLPFAFLDDICTRFAHAHSDAADSQEQYSLNDQFAPVLEARMDFYNNDPQADAIGRTQVSMEEIRAIMISNMEQVLERGEKIELLVHKTDNLQAQAFTFRRQARSVDTHMWWKNGRLVAAVVLAIIIMGLVILMWRHYR